MDNGSKVTDLVILAGSIDPAMEHTAWYQYPADWPLISWMLPDVLVVTNREIRALKDELVAMLPLWPRVTQRVTVMQGGNDDLVPPENADFAQKMLTHATTVNIVRIPEMNHFLPWTRYAQVKAVNFTLVGEITGGRSNAFALREATGSDAALGIDDIPDMLEYVVKGGPNRHASAPRSPSNPSPDAVRSGSICPPQVVSPAGLTDRRQDNFLLRPSRHVQQQTLLV